VLTPATAARTPLPGATPVSARQVTVATDGTEIDITEDLKTLYDAVLPSLDRGRDQQSGRAALALSRLGHACGFVVDEDTTRSAMNLLGIDPGPVWDRPLHPDPRRTPIRPAALARYQSAVNPPRH
jgi:hypothetical protein